MRVPRAHYVVYEEQARLRGMPLSDYIGMHMARLHELDEPEYINRTRRQETPARAIPEQLAATA